MRIPTMEVLISGTRIIPYFLFFIEAHAYGPRYERSSDYDRATTGLHLVPFSFFTGYLSSLLFLLILVFIHSSWGTHGIHDHYARIC